MTLVFVVLLALGLMWLVLRTRPRAMPVSVGAVAIAASVFLLAVIADQAWRAYCDSRLAGARPGAHMTFLPGIEIVRAFDAGAAFGLGGVIRRIAALWVMVALTLTVAAAAGWWAARRSGVRHGWWAALAAGGALGNVVDLIRLGGVRDCFVLGRTTLFSLADVLAVVGLVGAATVMLLALRRGGDGTAPPQERPA
jgi:signal peptidase II